MARHSARWKTLEVFPTADRSRRWTPGATPQSPAATIQVTGYAHSEPLLYVGNISGYNDVKVYHANGKDPSSVAVISDDLDGPTGDCVDKKGYLYVTDHGNSGVVEFAPGSITPSNREISKGLFEPAGTAYSPPLLP